MAYRGKDNHIHPAHAFTAIGITLFFVVWLIAGAGPASANADEEAGLQSLINEKDSAAKNELLKPDVVMDIEESIPEEGDIPVIATNGEELSLTVLPKGKHQRIKSEITIIASSNINIKTLEKSFTIVPNVPGTFNVNGRVATFKPKNDLAPQTKYTVTIDETLHGVNGESLVKSVSQSFETEPNLKILSVPYFRQQFSRSCESASMRMALAFKGVNVKDMDVVKAAGYDPIEADWANRIWDNPYEQFVGYIDGPQSGYGMYASALSKAAKHFGRETKILTNPTAEQIASEVLSGNPVVMWGYINDTVPKLSYFYTRDGVRVPIYSNEHARTITGVVGSEHEPVGFYVHDPLSGRANEYWSKERLVKHMSIFGAVSNQALVVE